MLKWTGRIIGGVVIAGVAYVSTSFFSVLDELPQNVRLGIAGFFGVLFVLVGGNLWDWIFDVTDLTGGHDGTSKQRPHDTD